MSVGVMWIYPKNRNIKKKEERNSTTVQSTTTLNSNPLPNKLISNLISCINETRISESHNSHMCSHKIDTIIHMYSPFYHAGSQGILEKYFTKKCSHACIHTWHLFNNAPQHYTTLMSM